MTTTTKATTTKATTTKATTKALSLIKKDASITKKKLEAYLTIEDFTPAEIKEAIKEVLGETIKPKTFATEYYDYLAGGKRTEKEATDYIMGLGEYGETSANVQKHKSHYLNIHALTVTVWTAKA